MTPALDLLKVKRTSLDSLVDSTRPKRHMSMILMVSRSQASTADVRRIIRIARYRNEERNLTGCLLWTGSVFVQLLEGFTDVLSNACQSMYRDQKHACVRLLLQRRVSTRSYGGLPLAFVTSRRFDLDLLSFVHETRSREDCLQLAEMLMEQWISKRSARRATCQTWEPHWELAQSRSSA